MFRNCNMTGEETSYDGAWHETSHNCMHITLPGRMANTTIMLVVLAVQSFKASALASAMLR